MKAKGASFWWSWRWKISKCPDKTYIKKYAENILSIVLGIVMLYILTFLIGKDVAQTDFWTHYKPDIFTHFISLEF